jgi:hypothetical protein
MITNGEREREWLMFIFKLGGKIETKTCFNYNYYLKPFLYELVYF